MRTMRVADGLRFLSMVPFERIWSCVSLSRLRKIRAAPQWKLCVCSCERERVCVCVCVHACACRRVRVRVYVRACSCACMCVSTCMCARVCACVSTCTCMYACAYVFMQVQTSGRKTVSEASAKISKIKITSVGGALARFGATDA